MYCVYIHYSLCYKWECLIFQGKLILYVKWEYMSELGAWRFI